MERKIIHLTSWRFRLGHESNGWYRGADENGWESVSVPHDWAIRRGFSRENSSGTGYVCGGEGWYRTRFFCKPEPGKHVRITFEGVYNNSKVWCNSNYLGKRPYGYSTFTYDITEFLAADGDNCISVQVMHPETADSRWYTGSGITRPVYVTVTGEPYLDDFGVFVTAANVTAASADVHVKSTVVGDGNVTHRILDANGAAVAELSGANADVTLPSPERWEFGHPYLYTLETTVTKDGNVTDTLSTKFGIRDLRFDSNTGFYCNGKPTKLRGVCVHHDAGCLGAAVPKEVWRRRLLNLMACGTNAVRTSHNPPDPALLDLCDELGLYVMDEAFDEWEAPKNKWWHGHNVHPPKLNGYFEDFVEWSEKDIQTMVCRDRNHPCVILWSIGNEVDYPNDPYVYSGFDIMTGNNDAGKSESERRYDVNRPDSRRLTKIAEKLVSYVKACDTTRPVTAALAYPEMSVRIGYMQALDVAGYNYKEQFYAEHHREFPSAFLYGSENGHHPEAWEAVRDNDYISGQFLWTGIDYLGEAHGWPIRGSGAGVLDIAGYETFKIRQRRIMWLDKLDGMLFTRTHEGKTDAFCFTNAKEVELFANGQSVGKAAVEHYRCSFDMTEIAPDAELTVLLRDENGGEETIAQDKPGVPIEITAVPWASEYVDGKYEIDDGICQLEMTLTDENGRNVPNGVNNANRYDVTVTVLGGTLLGIENGDLADLTSYGENHRTFHNGRMLVYVRGEKGTVADIHLHVNGHPEFSRTVHVKFR